MQPLHTLSRQGKARPQGEQACPCRESAEGAGSASECGRVRPTAAPTAAHESETGLAKARVRLYTRSRSRRNATGEPLGSCGRAFALRPRPSSALHHCWLQTDGPARSRAAAHSAQRREMSGSVSGSRSRASTSACEDTARRVVLGGVLGIGWRADGNVARAWPRAGGKERVASERGWAEHAWASSTNSLQAAGDWLRQGGCTSRGMPTRRYSSTASRTVQAKCVHSTAQHSTAQHSVPAATHRRFAFSRFVSAH